MVELLEDRIKVGERRDVLKMHLIIKCFQKGLSLSNADIDSLVELHEVGYGPEFFQSCVSKGYYKSLQTVRNAVSKMTIMGILHYEKRGERYISKEFIPDMKADKIMFRYTVGNI